MQQPQSTDALKIIPQLGRLDFIELKGFAQFVAHNKEKKNLGAAVERQIEKFDLEGKIRDSIFILSFFIRDKHLRLSKSEKRDFHAMEKNYLVVVDIDLYQNPMADRATTLAFLSEPDMKRKIVSELNQTIDNIPASYFDNLKKPLLLSCKTIDAFYQNLLNPEQS